MDEIIKEEKNRVEKSTLYLVATPIGNLADMSERAKKVLAEVDFVAAEDTRNSLKLLNCYSIHQELVSYYEHNKKSSGERIVERLKNGESCALITDAGMPAISDPGEDIVALCAEEGISVKVVPGCCACVSALSLSGLPTRKFVFEGFLPPQKGERIKILEELKHERKTVIFYEAPHKLKTTLEDMEEIFGGDRRISLCRELTKINEDVKRTTLSCANEFYKENSPRGEYVLVVEGFSGEINEENPLLSMSEEKHVEYYESQGMKRMDAIKATARDRGLQKSELYNRIMKK